MANCDDVYQAMGMKVKEIKAKLKRKGVKRYSQLTKIEAIKVLTNPEQYEERYTAVGRQARKRRRRRAARSAPKSSFESLLAERGQRRANQPAARAPVSRERAHVEESQARRLQRLRATVAAKKKKQNKNSAQNIPQTPARSRKALSREERIQKTIERERNNARRARAIAEAHRP